MVPLLAEAVCEGLISLLSVALALVCVCKCGWLVSLRCLGPPSGMSGGDWYCEISFVGRGCLMLLALEFMGTPIRGEGIIGDAVTVPKRVANARRVIVDFVYIVSVVKGCRRE